MFFSAFVISLSNFPFSSAGVKSLETFLITGRTLVLAKHIHKHARTHVNTRALERSHMPLLTDSYWGDEHKQARCWVTESSRADQFPLPWKLNISLFTFVQGWDWARVTGRKQCVATSVCVCVCPKRTESSWRDRDKRYRKMKTRQKHPRDITVPPLHLGSQKSRNNSVIHSTMWPQQDGCARRCCTIDQISDKTNRQKRSTCNKKQTNKNNLYT